MTFIQTLSNCFFRVVKLFVWELSKRWFNNCQNSFFDSCRKVFLTVVETFFVLQLSKRFLTVVKMFLAVVKIFLTVVKLFFDSYRKVIWQLPKRFFTVVKTDFDRCQNVFLTVVKKFFWQLSKRFNLTMKLNSLQVVCLIIFKTFDTCQSV